jgi:hypothetical protein
MSTTRKISTVAALTASTAVVAMLTGISAARAGDLQANQQLLDERIDQIAAGQFSGPSVQFSTDQNTAAAGAPVSAGSFPRSILIPGTDTSIKIYGQITTITDYFMTGGPPNGSPQTTTVGTTGQLESLPLNDVKAVEGGQLVTTGGNPARSRSNGIFQTSPRETRFGIETRTPTPLGEARTLIEMDFAGSSGFAPGGAVLNISNSLVPRLRYAYGTLGGLLAGQATSNFSDPDANPETIDFGGPAGEPGKVRTPQIRYTMPAWNGSSFSVSAETPETTAASAAGVFASDSGASTVTGPVTPTVVCTGPTSLTLTCTSTAVAGNVAFATNPLKATAPNLTAAWYMPQPWGHFDVSGVLLPGIDVADGKYVARSFIGYGGHVGADYKPGWFGWAKDDILGQFEIGQGLGSYINASSSVQLQTNYPIAAAPATVAAASLVLIKPVTEIGGTVGYQHWWMDNLRSNISGGFEGINLSPTFTGQTSSLNTQLITAHANLIWNPVSFVDVGIEYFWGQRTAVTNQHATMNALIQEFKFRF